MFDSVGLRIRWPFLAATMMGLSACGGGGGTPESSPSVAPGPLNGALMDIEGVEYTTLTQSGRTGPGGAFKYVQGETVTFSLGGITLGSATGAAFVSPMDFFNVKLSTQESELRAAFRNQENVSDFDRGANTLQFLATLDKDCNPNNGIAIGAVPDFTKDGLSFDAPLALFAAGELADFVQAHGLRSCVMTGLPLVHLYRLTGITVPFHALAKSEQDFRDDGAVDEATTYEYDLQGRWITVGLDDDADGNADETHRRTYTAAGLVESQTLEDDRDDDGVPNFVTIERSSYDAKGNATQFIVEHDEPGRPTWRSTETSTYNDAGFLSKKDEKIDIDDNGTADQSRTVEYVRDSHGFPLEWTESGDNDADGTPDYIRGTVNTLDEHGRFLTSLHRVDNDGDGIFDSRITIEFVYFDENNSNTVTTEAHRADGTLASRDITTATLDAHGRTLGLNVRRDNDANGVIDFTYSLERTYAKHGLLASETIIQDNDGDGAREHHSIQTNAYDDSGQHLSRSDVLHNEFFPNQQLQEEFTYGPDGALRTSLLTADDDGNTAIDRSWRTTYTYNVPGNGLLPMVQYFFGEGRFKR